jgi:hypothetical protein
MCDAQKHAAPLGLMIVAVILYYKHVAPMAFKTGDVNLKTRTKK